MMNFINLKTVSWFSACSPVLAHAFCRFRLWQWWWWYRSVTYQSVRLKSMICICRRRNVHGKIKKKQKWRGYRLDKESKHPVDLHSKREISSSFLFFKLSCDLENGSWQSPTELSCSFKDATWKRIHEKMWPFRFLSWLQLHQLSPMSIHYSSSMLIIVHNYVHACNNHSQFYLNCFGLGKIAVTKVSAESKK